MQEITAGREAATAALALDEVMWVLFRDGRRNQVAQTIEDIYAIPNLTVHAVPAEAPLHALPLLDKLAPRDALHVVMMRELGCDTIVTDDSDFDKVPGITRVKL